MTNSFLKDAILGIKIDYFCLVCEIRFYNKEDVVEHIGCDKHKEMFEHSCYLNGFENNFIRKTKLGYVCEPCEMFISTLDGVASHVDQSDHRKKCNMKYFKRIYNNVVICNNLLISPEAWEGIISDVCVVCNVSNIDSKKHIVTASHALNLIQNIPQYSNDAVCRKVTNNMIQCLTCNKLVTMMDSHFASVEHKFNYKSCADNAMIFKESSSSSQDNIHLLCNQMPSSTQNVIMNSSTNSMSLQSSDVSNDNLNEAVTILNFCILCHASNIDVTQHLKENHGWFLKVFNFLWRKIPCESEKRPNSVIILKFKKESININDKYKIVNDVMKFQASGIDINFEKEMATCKKCMVNICFEYDSIIDHVKDHELLDSTNEKSNANKDQTKNEITDDKVSFDDIMFAIVNKLKFNVSTRTAFCSLCDMKYPLLIENMKMHINSDMHKTKIHQYETDTKVVGNNLESKFIKKPDALGGEANTGLRHFSSFPYYKNNFHYDYNKKVAYCKLCKCYVSTVKDMEDHLNEDTHKLKESKKSPEIEYSENSWRLKTSVTSLTSDLIDFAVKNNFHYDPKNKNVICKICKCTIKFTLQNMETHLNEDSHISKLTSNNALEKPENELKDLPSQSNKELIERHAMNNKLHCENNKIICQFCNCKIPSHMNNIDEHIKSKKHQINMNLAKTSVIETCSKTNQQNNIILSNIDPSLIAMNIKNINNSNIPSNSLLDKSSPRNSEKEQKHKIDKLSSTKADDTICKTECDICNCKVPVSGNNWKLHITGRAHQTKLLALKNSVKDATKITQPNNRTKKQKKAITIKTNSSGVSKSVCTPEKGLDYTNVEQHKNNLLLEMRPNNIKDTELPKKVSKQKVIPCKDSKCIVSNTNHILIEHGNNKTKQNSPIKEKDKNLLLKNNKQHTVQQESLVNLSSCKVCECDVTPSTKSWNEHINSYLHKTNLLLKKTETNTSAMVNDQQNIETIKNLDYKIDVCKVCDCAVPTTEKNWREHLNGNSHKTNLLLKEKKNHASVTISQQYVTMQPKTKKIPNENSNISQIIALDQYSKSDQILLSSYIKTFTIFKDNFSKYIILNSNICLSYLSFFTIVLKNLEFSCFICNVEGITCTSLKHHVCSAKHIKNTLDVTVVPSSDLEFIRKIQNSYHCGLCNALFKSWESLQEHGSTLVHREAVVISKWHLHFLKKCPTVGFQVEIGYIFNNFDIGCLNE